MVPTDAVINFRFKNAKETDIQKFTFSGSSVTLKELKTYISTRHKLDQKSSRPDKTQAPSELLIEDLATGQVYLSDETDIPNGATVIVARKLAGSTDPVSVSVDVPVITEVTAQPLKPLGTKKVIQRSASDLNEKQIFQATESNAVAASINGSLSTGGLNDPKWTEMGFVDTVHKNTDLSELDWSDEKKTFAMQYQCLLFYDHTVFTRIRVSQNAHCQKCGMNGHWSKNCPHTGSHGGVEYQTPGAPRGRNGAIRQPTVMATTVTTNPDAYASIPVDSGEYEDVPAELRCGICQNIIRDAIRVPCCDKSFCDSCIRNLLISDSGSYCPNCKSEVQFDQCVPDTFVRDSVAKWEREMQVKRQKKKDDASSASKTSNSSHESIKKESSTSPASGSATYHGPTRNNVYNRQQTGSGGRPEQTQFIRRGSTQYDDSGKSSEPMPIGSVLGRSMPAINASMFQTPQESNRIRPAGFPVNSGQLFMNNNSAQQQRTRGDIRPTPTPMGFFNPAQFPDFASYMGAAGFPGVMDPAAAFAMGRRLNNPAAYMSSLRGFAPFMGVGGAQNEAAMAAMFKQQTQQFQRTIAVQAQQQQQQQQNTATGAATLPGPNLRITRTPNQPKVPILSPFDTEHRSPDKTRSSDDYRDKDRRDKDDDRRRDDRKYDDRDRRSGEKRRGGSHDDRRSPDRRRDSSRDRKRPRIDSPDRRDPKRDSSSRAETSRPLEKDRDRPRREEITPPSKSGSNRASEKDREPPRDVRPSEKDRELSREVKVERIERPRLREIEVKTEALADTVGPASSDTKVKLESFEPTPPAPAEEIVIKKEPLPSVTPYPLISVKLEMDCVPAVKPIERPEPAVTSRKEVPTTNHAPIRAPSPEPPVVNKSVDVTLTDRRTDVTTTSIDGPVKDHAGESKKDRDKDRSKKDKSDKDKSSRSSRKERKPSKSSRDKRQRSESEDQRTSTKKKSERKKPPVKEGVVLEHLRDADVFEDDIDNHPGANIKEERPEKRSHKSSRSKKEKDSTSSKLKRTSASPEPHRESRKRDSRKNSETDDVRPAKEKKRPKGERSEKKEKSSHKSSKSSRREKSSKSGHDRGDGEEGSSRKEKSSGKRDRKEETKIVDARAILDEQRARLEASPRGRDRDYGDSETSSRKRSDPGDSRRNSDDVAAEEVGKVRSGRSHKSKRDKSEKSKSARDKSSRSSPGEKKRHKKKHRRDKREAGEIKSPLGDGDRKSEHADGGD